MDGKYVGNRPIKLSKIKDDLYGKIDTVSVSGRKVCPFFLFSSLSFLLPLTQRLLILPLLPPPLPSALFPRRSTPLFFPLVTPPSSSSLVTLTLPSSLYPIGTRKRELQRGMES
jgi:hypothetical protein